ncbi:MAG: hypothetical protein ACR2PZ_01160 [Pseudomonadales bacterium]
MLNPLRQRHLHWLLFILLAAMLLNAGWARAALVSRFSAAPCDPQLLAGARARVELLFGEVRSKPIVACLNRPVLGLNVSHGQTSFAPWVPAVVLLGPEGQNMDVAAHEWMHAELSARVGVLTRTYGVPTWFDEGLAMQVDMREEYGDGALQSLLGRDPPTARKPLRKLAQISTPRAFFDSDILRGRLHYAFARCVIGHWLGSEGGLGLLNSLQDFHWLRSFESLPFIQAEQRCLAASR